MTTVLTALIIVMPLVATVLSHSTHAARLYIRRATHTIIVNFDFYLIPHFFGYILSLKTIRRASYRLCGWFFCCATKKPPVPKNGG